MDEISNRSAIIVSPKEPFVKWVMAESHGNSSIEALKPWVNEEHIFLISWSFQEEIKKVLEPYYAKIFEFELSEWDCPKQTWPKDRSCELFLEWFNVDFCDGLFDLGTETILTEDTDDE